jgi:hypothetical protein
MYVHTLLKTAVIKHTTYACIHAHIYTHYLDIMKGSHHITYTYTYHICMHTCTYIHSLYPSYNIHTHVHIHIHICIHTCTYVYPLLQQCFDQTPPLVDSFQSLNELFLCWLLYAEPHATQSAVDTQTLDLMTRVLLTTSSWGLSSTRATCEFSCPSKIPSLCISSSMLF